MCEEIKALQSLWCKIPDGIGWLEIPPRVLKHFERFQQRKPSDKESGGQLFWEPTSGNNRRISAITGPRPSDTRSRFAYKADHEKEQFEIDRMYNRGQYFLGDWHTHPEPVAKPSADDIKAIQEIYRTTKNPGPGFLLVIVGTDSIQESISISWCNLNITPLKISAVRP